MKEHIQTSSQYLKSFYRWGILSFLVGVACGLVGSVFHMLINLATETRLANPWLLYLLPFGGLTARLGYSTYGNNYNKYLEHIGLEPNYTGPVANSGDGQHDGDIGGGQLINAYSWYIVITGDRDLTDNMYKPDYEMSDALWNMLKQAVMTTYAADHPAQ